MESLCSTGSLPELSLHHERESSSLHLVQRRSSKPLPTFSPLIRSVSGFTMEVGRDGDFDLRRQAFNFVYGGFADLSRSPLFNYIGVDPTVGCTLLSIVIPPLYKEKKKSRNQSTPDPRRPFSKNVPIPIPRRHESLRDLGREKEVSKEEWDQVLQMAPLPMRIKKKDIQVRSTKSVDDITTRNPTPDKMHSHSAGEIKSLSFFRSGKMSPPSPAEEEDDEDGDFAIVKALLRNSEKDTVYKFPVKLKTEHYKAKELLKTLRNFYNHISFISFHPIEDTVESSAAFAEYEDAVTVRQFKFGVLYFQGDQNENQMYNNVKTSEAYEKFLELLGERVPLKSRTEWSGGLDTKNDNDGKYSITCNHQYGDVIFHVATMMKHVEGDVQQIAKKRHLGNDVVLIIFKEDRGTFSPAFMASHFNHVFIVVKKLVSESKRLGKILYRVSVTARENVGQFSPYLPKDQKFEHGSEFSDWLLAKCINGELASYQAPGLGEPRKRVKETLLRSCLTKFRTTC
eukprot:TRINITY_DN3377_c0_g1_i1.p1 TRINITY_DN3377_c0_g1~~TRINITY_DN3377_c0_g1_i1.p1  ORF type:complete len:512 (-),score=66.84 TRINITY_DN3377_c0_g1_i1:43-1578(-)